MPERGKLHQAHALEELQRQRHDALTECFEVHFECGTLLTELARLGIAVRPDVQLNTHVQFDTSHPPAAERLLERHATSPRRG